MVPLEGVSLVTDRPEFSINTQQHPPGAGWGRSFPCICGDTQGCGEDSLVQCVDIAALTCGTLCPGAGVPGAGGLLTQHPHTSFKLSQDLSGQMFLLPALGHDRGLCNGNEP